jgi:hypothetical protein
VETENGNIKMLILNQDTLSLLEQEELTMEVIRLMKKHTELN